MSPIEFLHKLNPWALEYPASSGGVPVDFLPFLIVTTIGFIVIVWFVWKVIPGPMIRGILDERAKSIANADDQVTQTMQEIEQMRNDYRQRLDQIEAETRQRMAEAEREAENLRDNLLSEGRAQAEAIEQRGQDEIARERAKAISHLRLTYVNDIIGAAEYAASRSLSGDKQKSMVDAFVQNVQNVSANGAGARS